MEPSLLLVVAIFVGAFALGLLLGFLLGRNDRTSKTEIVWRDSEGNAFKTLTYYGEYENHRYLSELSPDYYQIPEDFRASQGAKAMNATLFREKLEGGE